MANWTKTIDLSKEWDTEDVGKISQRVVNQLQNIGELEDSWLELSRTDLIDSFSDLMGGGSYEEFNSLIDELYDWADSSLDVEYGGDKLAWVKTF